MWHQRMYLDILSITAVCIINYLVLFKSCKSPSTEKRTQEINTGSKRPRTHARTVEIVPARRTQRAPAKKNADATALSMSCQNPGLGKMCAFLPPSFPPPAPARTHDHTLLLAPFLNPSEAISSQETSRGSHTQRHDKGGVAVQIAHARTDHQVLLGNKLESNSLSLRSTSFFTTTLSNVSPPATERRQSSRTKTI